ncbi:hypothetical protein BSKO_01153 [Bryopsis sp. KO-2023]|nr:hypothetical protein BSKO_01153 [Bryopsis sp. KO-2023]
MEQLALSGRVGGSTARQAVWKPLAGVRCPHICGQGRQTFPAQRYRTQRVTPKAAAVEAPELSKMEIWGDDKRLQTQVLDVGEDTITIRSLDWDRDRFDIEFGLENGTTYNSYLIFGEKTALVDASHEKFEGLYLEALKKELEERGRKIDYIIVSHTEPDHSGLIPAVLDMYPDAVVAGSKVCLQFLEGLTHRPFTPQVVKGGSTIDLGEEHVLEFVMAPNLHWPDTMFSYDRASGIMFTCDAFGMHYCTEDPFDSHLKDIESHYRFYYDCLMRPNARSVLSALKRVKDLDYSVIATGHGPLLRYNVEEMVGMYQEWSAAVGKAAASVAVLYSNSYGYCDRISQTIARGITKAGVATEMVDILSIDTQEMVEIMGRNSGIVIMAPPADSSDAQRAISVVVSSVKPKKQKVIIAESYGGRDEPVDTLLASFVGVGVDPVMEPLRVKEEPDEALYQQMEEAGTDLAQALQKKQNIKEKLVSMPPDVAKAIARLSSGLYVVTAARGNARSAMIASWVAQASMEPLGLTIAVAKDRAIESLMQVGDRFVLNVLGEGNYGKLMKHFLQRFGAGADRFEGVEWFNSNCGSPVLREAVAYMECKVVERLETSDHWVTYCEVVDGSVSDTDTLTAVHRRQVGYYY